MQFSPSPGPLTSIQMFSTSSYQTVVSRGAPKYSGQLSPYRDSVRGRTVRGSISGKGKRFLQNRPDRLRSQSRLIQWIPGISPPRVKGLWQCSRSLNLNVSECSCVTCTKTWFLCFMCAVDLVLMYSSICSDTLIVANL